MQDEHLTTPPLAVKARRSWRSILLAAFLAFILGAALAGWLAWRGELDFAFPGRAAPPAQFASPAAGTNEAEKAVSTVEARLAMLEARLSRIDVQSHTASGNAARAESLLIAFAARRMIDRGAPLGYIEDQLRLRFADAQPNAVRIIVDAAKSPLTKDELCSQLDILASSLIKPANEMDGWTWIKRELSGLFVIRRETPHAIDPESRVGHAKVLLAVGKIEDAIAEVERLPGAEEAHEWIAAARRYDQTQRALDLIETTAMLEPSRLQDSEGRNVEEPSPLAAPAEVKEPAA